MSKSARTFSLVGSCLILGCAVRDRIEMVRIVRRGLPVGAVQHLLDSGRPTPAEPARVVLPRKTLASRRKTGRLTAEQSDRLVRVARIVVVAEETFGNRQKAAAWLRRATGALAGERPLDLLHTDAGGRAVETLLGRVSHGIAA